jgi:carbamoyl-phosphate synthase large subunit
MTASGVTVLVTGVGGGGLGHEVVKSLRLAGGYRLIGADTVADSFGFADVDEAYVLPPASAPDYVDVLIDLGSNRGARVVIPGSEAELRVISRHRDRFADADLLPLINSADVIDIGLDKSRTMAFLDDHGFARPRSILVRAAGDVPADFVLPAIVKPAIGGGGSSDTFVVQERDELDFVCAYLLRQGRAVLLQEYVGTPSDEYTVGVVHSLDGAFVGSIAIRRHILGGMSNRIKAPNRTGRSELGSVLAVSSGISQGVIDDFPDVRRGCEAIANALGSRGPLNIQCRFAGGVLYPFEINPRFSGTTYLRAIAGYNEPDVLIRHHVLGEPFPSPVRYAFGAVIRGLTERHIAESSAARAWSVAESRELVRPSSPRGA